MTSCPHTTSSAVIQRLEPRRLLSAPLHAHKTLEVVGTEAAENITVSRDGKNIVVHVDGQLTRSVKASHAKHVIVRALGGDDRITVAGDIDARLDGGAGNDTFVGGSGADTFVGGEGTDTADYSAARDALSLSLDGQANDGVRGEGNNLGHDIEVLIGGNGADRIVGNHFANTLRGGGGDDTLVAGLGNDLLAGEGGFDTHDYSDRTISLRAVFAFNGFVTIGPETDTLAPDDAYAVLGGSGNDTMFVLASFQSRLAALGGGGSDVLAAAGFDETGVVTLRGGDGNDLLVTGTELGASNFFAFGDDGNDVCRSGQNIDFHGGRGIDTLDHGESALVSVIDLRRTPTTENVVASRFLGGLVTGNDADNFLSIAPETDSDVRMLGLAGDDTIIGGNGEDTIEGGAGDDVIDGFVGSDLLIGGPGRDTFLTRDGFADTLDGSGGVDRGQVDLIDLLTSIEQVVS